MFEALGDRRSLAVTSGDTPGSRSHARKRRLWPCFESLQIFETLGDRRQQAVTWATSPESWLAMARSTRHSPCSRTNCKFSKHWTIARRAWWSWAQSLGSRRRAVDEALKLHNERLRILRRWAIRTDRERQLRHRPNPAVHAVEQSDVEAFQSAFEALTKSFEINLKIGRLDGICFVGIALGQAFAMAGEA